MHNVYSYILVMALVTYAIRVLPLTLIRRRIESRFLRSFLYYVPFATLAAMTFPAIFMGDGISIWAAAAGFLTAIILAYRGKSLLVVAASACGAALMVQLMINVIQ